MQKKHVHHCSHSICFPRSPVLPEVLPDTPRSFRSISFCQWTPACTQSHSQLCRALPAGQESIPAADAQSLRGFAGLSSCASPAAGTQAVGQLDPAPPAYSLGATLEKVSSPSSFQASVGSRETGGSVQLLGVKVRSYRLPKRQQ